MKGLDVSLSRVLLVIALLLVIGSLLGASLWVFGGVRLLMLAVVLVIAAVW